MNGKQPEQTIDWNIAVSIFDKTPHTYSVYNDEAREWRFVHFSGKVETVTWDTGEADKMHTAMLAMS